MGLCVRGSLLGAPAGQAVLCPTPSVLVPILLSKLNGEENPKAEALRGAHTRGGPPCAGAEVLHFPPPAEQQTTERRPQNRASVGGTSKQ